MSDRTAMKSEKEKELAHPSDEVVSGNSETMQEKEFNENSNSYANDAGSSDLSIGGLQDSNIPASYDPDGLLTDVLSKIVSDKKSHESAHDDSKVMPENELKNRVGKLQRGRRLEGEMKTFIRDLEEVYEQLDEGEHVHEGEQGEIQGDTPSKDKDGINPQKIHSDKKSHEAVEEDCKTIQENKLICTDKLFQTNNSLQRKVMTPSYRELEKVDDQLIESEPVQEGQRGQIQDDIPPKDDDGINVLPPNRELEEVDDQLIESEPVQEGQQGQIQDDIPPKDDDGINVMPPNRELEEVDDQLNQSEPVQEGQQGQIQDDIPPKDDDGINENARKHSESLLVAERNQQTLLYILVVCVFLYFIFVQKL